MPTKIIYLIGAGGHAKVVLDALLAGGVESARIRVSDARALQPGCQFLGVAVDHPAVRPEMAGALFHIAVGEASTRARLHAEMLALGCLPLTVLHPDCSVSPHAAIGSAVFVAARAVVGPGAQVGDGAIVNHGAVVDHDCHVGVFSHIAPNATLGGAAQVGDWVLIGAGANVLPGMRVGRQAVIGAGAVVCKEVVAGQAWAGVPAVLMSKD